MLLHRYSWARNFSLAHKSFDGVQSMIHHRSKNIYQARWQRKNTEVNSEKYSSLGCKQCQAYVTPRSFRSDTAGLKKFHCSIARGATRRMAAMEPIQGWLDNRARLFRTMVVDLIDRSPGRKSPFPRVRPVALNNLTKTFSGPWIFLKGGKRAIVLSQEYDSVGRTFEGDWTKHRRTP